MLNADIFLFSWFQFVPQACGLARRKRAQNAARRSHAALTGLSRLWN
jgi:hypothetical protein